MTIQTWRCPPAAGAEGRRRQLAQLFQ